MKIKWTTKLRRLVRSSSTHDVFHENWRVNEQNLDTSSDAVSVTKRHDTGIDGLETILNVSQFLSILDYDLSVTKWMTLMMGFQTDLLNEVTRRMQVKRQSDS
jgi:hypothetical protein